MYVIILSQSLKMALNKPKRVAIFSYIVYVVYNNNFVLD
jgi:hypothetical protein